MQTLNIKVEKKLQKTKPVHDFYKDILNDLLDSTINNIAVSKININPYLLRPAVLFT